MADRSRRRSIGRRLAGAGFLTPALLAADGITLIPLTTDVAVRLVNGQPLDLACAPGWPHEETLPGIRLALEVGYDPGWLVLRDGVVVGECAVKGSQPYGGDVEISYGMAGPQRGRGMGTAVVAALTTWLLRQPGVDLVTADVRRDNAASIRVLEKAGFRREDGDPQAYLRFSRNR